MNFSRMKCLAKSFNKEKNELVCVKKYPEVLLNIAKFSHTYA